ncbi:hypothetical protein HDZ31DRAFT_64454 [Schizophyllum fasciatum]
MTCTHTAQPYDATPAQRCLRVPELVLLVCGELRAAGCHKSLAAFAASCGVVCGPALDVLWEALDSLVPLMTILAYHSCHPPEEELYHPLQASSCHPAQKASFRWPHEVPCRLPQEDSFYPPHQDLQGPDRMVSSAHISPEAWTRVYTYGRRVRAFTTPPRASATHRAVLALLAHHHSEGLSPTPFPFPRLHTLTFAYDRTHRAHLRLFLPPTLRTLRLDLRSAADQGFLLPALPALCPNLHALALAGIGRPALSALAERERVGVGAWRGLARVELPCALVGSLAHVARRTALRALRVRLGAGERWVRARASGFGALEELAVRTTCPARVGELLGAMSSTPMALKVFTVGIEAGVEDGDGSGGEAKRYFAALVGVLDLPALQKFVYVEEKQKGPQRACAWPEVTIDSILHYARCPNMSHFEVGFWADMNDDNLAMLARAWPRLEYFSLGANGDDSTSRATMATLAALVPFAAHCPLLFHLQIALDATHVPPSPPAPPKPRGVVPNICLRLSGSTMSGNVGTIGGYISAVFQSRKKIGVYLDSRVDVSFDPRMAVLRRVRDLQQQQQHVTVSSSLELK